MHWAASETAGQDGHAVLVANMDRPEAGIVSSSDQLHRSEKTSNCTYALHELGSNNRLMKRLDDA